MGEQKNIMGGYNGTVVQIWLHRDTNQAGIAIEWAEGPNKGERMWYELPMDSKNASAFMAVASTAFHTQAVCNLTVEDKPHGTERLAYEGFIDQITLASGGGP